MTYIIKQMIKGRYYAYEVESYWDSIKKQARQKRKYLGVWDEENGEIKKKESQRSIKMTKNYGAPYLLHQICKGSELFKNLLNAFDKDGRNLLALTMSKVMRPSSLKNIHHLMEDSFIPELCEARGSFTSQWLSRFLESISLKEHGMEQFYVSLISESDKDALAYDITSLSSKSKMLDWLDYGYNRDGLNLPQVNLGLVMSLKRKIPIYYKLFPGSISDVVTLKNLIADMKAMGIESCTLILDRGFYSESNINEMLGESIEFVIPLPFSVKAGKLLISETNKEIQNPLNAKRYNGKVYHVFEKTIDLYDKPVYAYALFDKERESREITSFYNRLMDIESNLEGKVVHGNPLEMIDRVAGKFKRYLDFSVTEGVIVLKRRANAISQTANRFGKTILLSSVKMEWKDVLTHYRQRDAVEKEYSLLKNELEVMPMGVRKMETMKGLLFVFFISLIIRSLLLNRAKDAGLLEKGSVDDLLFEMEKLRVVNIGNVWRLSEVSKKQRVILEKLGMGVPVEPLIVGGQKT